MGSQRLLDYKLHRAAAAVLGAEVGNTTDVEYLRKVYRSCWCAYRTVAGIEAGDIHIGRYREAVGTTGRKEGSIREMGEGVVVATDGVWRSGVQRWSHKQHCAYQVVHRGNDP